MSENKFNESATTGLSGRRTDPDLPPLGAPGGQGGLYPEGRFGRWFSRSVLVVGLALSVAVTVVVSVLRPPAAVPEPVPIDGPEGAEAGERLREIHAAQAAFFAKNGVYTRDLNALGVLGTTERFIYRIQLVAGGEGYVAFSRWKDRSRVPQRFLQIDKTGRMTLFKGPRGAPRAPSIVRPESKSAAPPAVDPGG
jgi:hypothetical protein